MQKRKLSQFRGSFASSAKSPVIITISPEGLDLFRIPEELLDRLLTAVSRVIGDANVALTAYRTSGFWQIQYFTPLDEKSRSALRTRILNVFAMASRRGR